MKRFFTSLLFVLLLCSALCITAFAAGEWEENDIYVNANWVDVNEDVTGSISSTRDYDWFCFELPEDGMISVSFSHDRISTKSDLWVLHLYQEDAETGLCGKSTNWNISGDKNLVTSQYGLPRGTYYFMVESFSSSSCESSDYTVRVNFTPSQVWEKEVNGFYLDATLMDVNTDYYGAITAQQDDDWFCFELERDGMITVDFSHERLSSKNKFWTMHLFREDGETNFSGKNVYWYLPGDKDFTSPEIGLPAGTYYVKLESYSSSSWESGTYTLRVNFTESDVWEKEINGFYLDGTQMDLNTDYYGSIVDYDDTDWYWFDVPEAGCVNIAFSHPRISTKAYTWEFRLFQADGSTPFYGKSYRWDITGAENLTTADLGLAPGSYCIQVDNFGSSSFDPTTYTIRVNYTPSFQWEQENNGFYLDGTQMALNTDYFGSITCYDDSDWYRVDVPESGNLNIVLTHPAISGKGPGWKIAFYQDDGFTFVSKDNKYWRALADHEVTASAFSIPAGTYYILVESGSSSDANSTTYAIRADFSR